MNSDIIIPIFFYTNVIDEIETENGPYANSPSKYKTRDENSAKATNQCFSPLYYLPSIIWGEQFIFISILNLANINFAIITIVSEDSMALLGECKICADFLQQDSAIQILLINSA